MTGIPRVIALTLSAGLLSPAATAAEPAPRGVEFFEKKIRPVLVEHCYRCHSAEAQVKKLRGGLRLDTRAGVHKGGDSGPAVVPGKPEKSLLIKALKHDGDVKMPSQQKKLPDSVIADFEAWVRMGAPDPRDGKTASGFSVEKGRSYWAFQPPHRHPAPKVKAADWPARELDCFVLAEQEKRGLRPVRPATRAELIRRASFDLTGLPPTPEEVEAFEADPAPDAYEKVIERLLASPHYGERWGRHWLDVARYTDDLGGTVGPVPAPNSFRYRDWVIDALNRDLPYDRFVRLQLAGDLVTEPADDWVERLGGLGFQGLGQRFSGNAVGMVKKKAADELDDRVDTVTRSLLGLTLSCARCHDHKFDPIPQADYYSLAAAYNGARWPVQVALASPRDVEALTKWQAEVAALRSKVQRLPAGEARRLGREELPRIASYLLAAWELNVLARQKRPADVSAIARREKLVPAFLARWARALSGGKPFPLLDEWHAEAERAAKEAPAGGAVVAPRALRERAEAVRVKVARALVLQAEVEREANRKKGRRRKVPQPEETLLRVFLLNDNAPFKPAGKEAEALLSGPLRERHEANVAALERLTKTSPPAPLKAPGVNGGGQPMRINVRGNPERLGDEAPPGFLQVLRPPGQARGKAFTRLDLADAIASRDNPLTARVWVNRVWHHHFGRGIVATPGNFGALGARPTHPGLLDTLAVRFMEAGWSTKWLHREIMLSSTYRLGSANDDGNAARDADNHFLWRMAPRRLDFEAWRDAMLAVSGTLDRRMGGSAGQAGKGRRGQLHPDDPANARRTVYSFVSRFEPNPTLTLFDFPEPNVTSERRGVTTVPQQQLFALNSPFALAQAKAFAARVERERKGEKERIERAWRLAYGRAPTDREIELSQGFLREADEGEKRTPWERLCHAILATNEFAFVH